jgi:hypothetical protein
LYVIFIIITIEYTKAKTRIRDTQKLMTINLTYIIEYLAAKLDTNPKHAYGRHKCLNSKVDIDETPVRNVFNRACTSH